MKTLNGGCLCGAVTFEVSDDFDHFQLCHCTQCQKTTGTAHASNLFTRLDQFTWLTGPDTIARYDVEGRSISNAFCTRCGSRVPYVSRSGRVMVVPAGSLDEQPGMVPKANIFWPERAGWYDQGLKAPAYDTFVD